jgi:F-type H+-transporting ATPase subunit gamma
MSDTTRSLCRKIRSAGDLQSVVRTMKTLAASSIGQYEKSVSALADYYRTVELGLGACFRKSEPAGLKVERKRGAIFPPTIGKGAGRYRQAYAILTQLVKTWFIRRFGE